MSCQFSVFSFQFSVFSGQFSVFSGQWAGGRGGLLGATDEHGGQKEALSSTVDASDGTVALAAAHVQAPRHMQIVPVLQPIIHAGDKCGLGA